MDNSETISKNKSKKERISNNSNAETNDSPFITPQSSPIFESTSQKVSIIDNKLNSYNLSTKPKEKQVQEREEEKQVQEREEEKITLDSLILHLKIISKLKPGYKLSLRDNDCKKINEIYIDTSYLQYFYRIFSDNSRDHTIKFLETLDKEITNKIEELVKETYYDSNMFLNSKENILLNLSHNLNLSLVGLNNLINTYTNDEYIISKIEIIINNFELKIRKISNILKVNE